MGRLTLAAILSSWAPLTPTSRSRSHTPTRAAATVARFRFTELPIQSSLCHCRHHSDDFVILSTLSYCVPHISCLGLTHNHNHDDNLELRGTVRFELWPIERPPSPGTSTPQAHCKPDKRRLTRYLGQFKLTRARETCVPFRSDLTH